MPARPSPFRSPVASVVPIALLLAAAAGSTPLRAAVFTVTSAADGIPAPPGSLRKAVEASQANMERDKILIPTTLPPIHLVAPLPAISSPEGVDVIALQGSDPPTRARIDGSGLVTGAFTLSGGTNRLEALQFSGFTGPQVVAVTGAAADTAVTDCGFTAGPSPIGDETAGVRVFATPPGASVPEGTRITRSDFRGLTRGIFIDASSHPGTAASPTVISDNRFAATSLGGPDGTNGQAVTVVDHGPVEILRNLVGATATWGLSLEGSSGRISGNTVGLHDASGAACAGSGGPAIRLVGSKSVVVDDNQASCSVYGLFLGANTTRPTVRDNLFGSADPGASNSGDGILIDGASGWAIRGNEIARSGGAGIRVFAAGSPASVKSYFSCNRIWGQPGAAIIQSPSAPSPPVLTAASPLALLGHLVVPAAGTVEVYGGESEDAFLLLGSVETSGSFAGFQHQLPVTNLMVGSGPGTLGTRIVFDAVYPSRHVATLTTGQTTGTSASLAANSSGLLFDVVRGKVSNLARAADGAVLLGPLDCLASGIGPGSLPVIDSGPPPSAGTAFYYLARRRVEDGTTPGTYDPAMCEADLGDAFQGPRRPGIGDCSP